MGTIPILFLNHIFMKFLRIIAFILFPSLLFAQAPEEEALLQQLNGSGSSSLQNAVLIQQEGMYHQTSVQQSEAQHSQIQVQQSGEAHQLEAVQQGQNNQWDIQQTGEQHQFTGSLVGNNNQVQVHQSGQQNSIQQDLIGNGMDYFIVQEGSQLELIQIEYNPLAPAYDVQQRGAGMTVIIEQGFPIND